MRGNAISVIGLLCLARPKKRISFSALLPALLIIGIVLSACVRAPFPTSSKPVSERPPERRSPTLHPVAYGALPGWEADRHGAIVPVFLKSCEKISRQPPNLAFGPRAETGKIHHWISLCHEAARIPPGNHRVARYFIERRFTPYAVESGSRWAGLFTGYYEPELRGALRPDARFTYPILGLPHDLIRVDLGRFHPKWRSKRVVGRMRKGAFIPYYDRAQIEAGALAGQKLALLWVDDPVDAFFLHIQGSGRARLPDGSHVRLGYAGHNGRPYTAIGRELVAAGEMALEDVSMPAIRRWIAANPVAGRALMRKNQAYIFFRVRESHEPVGAQGVALTPGRSLAVDTDYIPLGAPLWLSIHDPGTKRPLRRLVVAQDTGTAIRGAVRGDLFWGYGRHAAEKAGIMKEMGRYYILLPRAATFFDSR